MLMRVIMCEGLSDGMRLWSEVDLLMMDLERVVINGSVWW